MPGKENWKEIITNKGQRNEKMIKNKLEKMPQKKISVSRYSVAMCHG